LGGSLALHVASRTSWIAGVFTISAPFRLKDYSTQFLPVLDVWDTMLQKMTGQQMKEETLDFLSEPPPVHYGHTPAAGIREADKLLEELGKQIKNLKAPVLLLHSDEDPVVHVKSARLLFAKVGSEQKELDLLHGKRHFIVQGSYAHQLQERIVSFIRAIS
jgi:carboxylesterase